VRARALTVSLSRKGERGAEAEGACGRALCLALSRKRERGPEEGEKGVWGRALSLALYRERERGSGGSGGWRLGVPAVLAFLAVVAPAVASPSPTARIQPRPGERGEVGAAAVGEGPAASPPPAAFAPAVTDDADVVLFPAARRPGPRPVVTVATRVEGSPTAVGAVLLDPARYRAALPSLIRAEVVATGPTSTLGGPPDRLLAWELEIPLFNLKGKAWLTRNGDAVELTLVEGAFAPGRVRFRVAPDGDGRAILVTEAQVEARSANWIFRRIARHDPWSETAMTAAAAFVLARAVALEAAEPHLPARGPARADGPMAAPAATTLDGTPLATAAFASLRKAGTVAIVHRTPRGRLAYVSAEVTVAADPTQVAARVNAPESWAAFPGWKSVTRLPSPPPLHARIAVEDDVAFVDFDATWDIAYAPSARATVIDGATRGAVLGWQTFPSPDGARPGSSLAVLSEHPRMDASGYVARKMIAAEPLMEHALALALTYADAAALADRF